MTLHQPDDQVRRDKAEALKVVHDRYAPMLLNFTRKFIRNETIAEDIVADVFAKLWGRDFDFNSSRGIEKVRRYLVQCAKNACIDELKKRTKQKEAELDYANAWFGDDSFIEGPAIQAQTLDKMLALIETLSPELFEVYFLIYVEGKRPGDAARLLDITDQELYKRHRKLKEQLGKYLGPGYMWILLSFSILLNTIKAN